MSKFYGNVGYVETVEDEENPGVWVEKVTTRPYFGDLLKNYRKLKQGSDMNDGIDISMDVSIVADPYAYQNFHAIRFVEYMGSRWKVTSVDVNYPRLSLQIGGLYNEQAET